MKRLQILLYQVFVVSRILSYLERHMLVKEEQITLIASLYPIGLRSFMNMDIFVWTYESIINMI